MEGWNIHVPLTFLTDKGCLLKNKSLAATSYDLVSFNSAGRLVTSSKPLPDSRELDLTFDEWHQAWRRLLELIKSFLPAKFLMWETHYLFILNNDNRAELWPVYLAYDVKIRKRATQSTIDPSEFSIAIWNDLEARYTAKKVLSMVQSDLKRLPSSSHNHTPHINPTHNNPNPTQNSSFRNHSQTSLDDSKTGRCIFCGDRTRSHLSQNCPTSCYSNGSPCYLQKQEPSGVRQSSSGQRYCFSWNGPSGCILPLCWKGDHACTLCGSSTHNAQHCDAMP